MKKPFRLATLFFCTAFAVSGAFARQAVEQKQEEDLPQAAEDIDIKITAKFDGTIKTKLETSTESGMMRFNVRNSRVGVRGMVGDYADYRIQVELSNEGTFSPLDLYGAISPTKNLRVIFGQSHVPFDNLYIITPAEMMFANRAFAGKYFTPGSRDIGLVVHYKFKTRGFPMEAQGGVFNGGKINNPQWTDNPSFAARLIFGAMEGWRTSVKVYRYHSELLDQFFSAADLRYANKRFRVESEIMNRHEYGTGRDLTGAYVQGAYTFPLKDNMFRSLSPAVRWDAMGYDVRNGFKVNRLTFGLDLGLSEVPFRSVLRLDYEQYFTGELARPYFDGRDLYAADNKLTLELVLKF